MMCYYSDSLAAERLKRCYELATPAVRRYLDAETRYVRKWIRSGDRVLELGCGYGRVLRELATETRRLVGIDTSLASLGMARRYLADLPHVSLVQSDAVRPALAPHSFDVVLCTQNGVSAFHADHIVLFENAAGLVAPGGTLLFSTYAREFWAHRLEWFRIQARQGLVGEIDEATTGDGTIVCKDGFTASTLDATDFRRLAAHIGVGANIQVVDGSSLFCAVFL